MGTFLTLRGSFWTFMGLRGSFWTFPKPAGQFLDDPNPAGQFLDDPNPARQFLDVPNPARQFLDVSSFKTLISQKLSNSVKILLHSNLPKIQFYPLGPKISAPTPIIKILDFLIFLKNFTSPIFFFCTKKRIFFF